MSKVFWQCSFCSALREDLALLPLEPSVISNLNVVSYQTPHYSAIVCYRNPQDKNLYYYRASYCCNCKGLNKLVRIGIYEIAESQFASCGTVIDHYKDK